MDTSSVWSRVFELCTAVTGLRLADVEERLNDLAGAGESPAAIVRVRHVLGIRSLPGGGGGLPPHYIVHVNHPGSPAHGSAELKEDQDYVRNELFFQAFDAISAVNQAVARVCYLHYFRRLTAQEIGQAEGISEKTADRRLKKAYALLAEAVKKLSGSPPSIEPWGESPPAQAPPEMDETEEETDEPPSAGHINDPLSATASLNSSVFWDRFFELADSLAARPLHEVEERLAALAAAGESTAMLVRLRIQLGLPPPPPGDDGILPTGTRVGGEYRIRQPLGRGGMGIVYEAVLENTGQTVALKTIRPGLVLEHMRERFLQEMKALGRLDHPGIVGIRHAGSYTTPSGVISEFFTMERITGISLHEYLASPEATLTDRLRLIRDAAIAVQYAHDRSVIHRDLKPGNMLIRHDGRLVIFDFGLSAALASDEETSLPIGAEGTPPYMAPEQANADPPAPAADIYSLGAILYEMLAGEPIYQVAPHALRSAKLDLARTPPPRRPLDRTDIPPAVNDVLDKALACNPEDRYPSAAAFARAINRLLPAYLVNEPPHKWHPAAGVAIPATDWVLEEKLGDGAQGQVWLARNRPLLTSSDNPLIPPPRVYKFCASEDAARSLRREQRVFLALKRAADAAASRHDPHITSESFSSPGDLPGIVPLEAWSLDEPPYYIAMRWIEGACDLREWLLKCQFFGDLPHASAATNGEEPSESTAIRIVCDIAAALQFASQNGVLHRDVSPANILVRTDPAAPGGVRAWLVDFGLAAFDANFAKSLLTTSITDTSSARLVGSPEYIAPEIKRGSPATTQSDLYSLGVILYRLLRRDLTATLTEWKQHISDRPLCDDLERCLADQPEKRFHSAGELAESIRGLPERRAAEEEGVRMAKVAEGLRRAELEAAKKRAYRKGVLRTATIAAAVVVALGFLAWLSYDKYREAWRNSSHLRLAEVRAVNTSFQPDRRSQILNRIKETNGDYHPDDIAGFRNEAIAALGIPLLSRDGGDSRGSVPPDAFVARGGRWLCWPEGSILFAAEVSETCIAVKNQIPLPRPVASCVVSSGGSIGAALLEDGDLYVYDLTGAVIQLAGGLATEGLAVHESGTVAAAGSNGRVFLFRRAAPGWVSGPVLGRTPPDLNQPSGTKPDDSPIVASAEIISFSPDGLRVAASGNTTLAVNIWDTRTGESLCRCENRSIPHAIVWDAIEPDVLWTLTSDASVSRWDITSPTLQRLPNSTPLTRRIASSSSASAWLDVSEDEPWLICSAGDGRRTILSKADLSIQDREGAPSELRSGFAGEGKLWSIDLLGNLYVAPSPQMLSGRRIGSMAVTRLASAPGGKLIAGSCGREIFVADSALHSLSRIPAGSLAVGLAFSPDGGELYASTVSALKVWGVQWQGTTYTIRDRPGNGELGSGADIAALSIDAKPWVALADGGRFLAFPRKGRSPDTTWEHPGTPGIHTLCASHQQNWFALARTDSTAVETHSPLTRSSRRFPARPDVIRGLTLSEDGNLCVERTDSSIFVSCSTDGVPVQSIALPSPLIDAVIVPQARLPIAISGDKQMIAATDASQQIRLFLRGQDTPVAILRLPHSASAISLAFTAEHGLIAGTSDGHIWLWDLPSIRRELRSMQLDWLPAAPPPSPSPPITVRYEEKTQ